MALRMFGEVFPLPRKPDDPYLPMWAVGVIIGSGIIALMWLIAFLAILTREFVLFRKQSRPSLGRRATRVHSPVGPQTNASTRSGPSSSHSPASSPPLDPCPEPLQEDQPPAPVDPANIPLPESLMEHSFVSVSMSEYSDHNGLLMSRPVTMSELEATLVEPNYLEEEFMKLPKPTVSPDTLPDGAEQFNRFPNVIPNPTTQVQLSVQDGLPLSQYINANYIRGFKNNWQYIATQGPMNSTVDSFWRMVWECGTTVIVMNTHCVERGISKSCKYWPDEGSIQYGAVTIKSIAHIGMEHFDHNLLEIFHQDNPDRKRQVSHYQLIFWPQQGVPHSTRPLISFLRQANLPGSEGPVMVHCSAGIGRSAIVITVDIGRQFVKGNNSTVDIMCLVSKIRQDRPGSVQSADQYRFIHQAIMNCGNHDVSQRSK